jgi:hypothetical protein
VYVHPKLGIITSGRAASLDEAKGQFLSNWQRCRAESSKNGSVYEYTMYADGGAYDITQYRIHFQVTTTDDGSADRTILNDGRVFNILKKTNGMITIGYGDYDRNRVKGSDPRVGWSEQAQYSAASFAPAFNYLITQCMDRMYKHVMPPPPPPRG